jgi:hypothetical protein
MCVQHILLEKSRQNKVLAHAIGGDVPVCTAGMHRGRWNKRGSEEASGLHPAGRAGCGGGEGPAGAAVKVGEGPQ